MYILPGSLATISINFNKILWNGIATFAAIYGKE